MPSYAVAGMVISTALELPEVRRVAEDRRGGQRWTVVTGDAPSRDAFSRVFEIHSADGSLWSTFGVAGDTYLLTFEGQVTFVIDAPSRVVTYAPEGADLAASTLRHLLLDQVVPRLAVIEGSLVLHASAVEVDGLALAFVGPSGCGKSSLAAAHVRRGANLLADDFLLLRREGDRAGFTATPAYPGLRLWGDSARVFADPGTDLPPVAGYSDKRRLAAPDAAPEDVPLAAIVVLGYEPRSGAPDCRIGPLRGIDGFGVLCAQAFRVQRSDRIAQRREMQRIADLIEFAPVYLLEYRRDYATLPAVLDLVAETVVQGRSVLT